LVTQGASPHPASTQPCSAEKKRRAEARILKELGELDLASSKRVAFYPLGAGEAMLLDSLKPGWPKTYWAEKFHLERFLE
jgi:hypothetical protein